MLDVQIPWSLRLGDANLEVDVPSSSPLVQRDRPFVFPQSTRFPEVAAGARGLLGGRLIKGDFSGYATELHAGDVVHMYFTGLGPVLGAVETGSPAPINELRPLASPMRCGFLPDPSAEADTVFAGLAPGTVGIYQVTFRIAAGTPTVPNGIQCSIGGSGVTFISAVQ
jgi:uncharacterized protein (TIGR03437 family)